MTCLACGRPLHVKYANKCIYCKFNNSEVIDGKDNRENNKQLYKTESQIQEENYRQQKDIEEVSEGKVY